MPTDVATSPDAHPDPRRATWSLDNKLDRAPPALVGPDSYVGSPPLLPGDSVEVLSPKEIAATLDSTGKLDGLPFMPEMLAFCGHRFSVLRRADATCVGGTLRKLEGTVQLERLRCDGSAHHGCQARCLLLWKEAWLRRVDSTANGGETRDKVRGTADAVESGGVRSLLNMFTTRRDGRASCQTTEILSATCPLKRETRWQYIGRLAGRIVSGSVTRSELSRAVNLFCGSMILRGFRGWAGLPRNLPRYKTTPTRSLNLKAGDLVKVRSVRQILLTLDSNGRNRGLAFTPEMFQFCGRRFRVLGRLEHMIDEDRGTMREFKNPCILLESVVCRGQRSACARGEYHYWREIWLDQLPGA